MNYLEQLEKGKDVTQALQFCKPGDRFVLDRLWELCYSRLYANARSLMSGERPEHTLGATGVLHEAYPKLRKMKRIKWKNRAHFKAITSLTMWRTLINYEKRTRAKKRGGHLKKKGFLEEMALAKNSGVDLLDLADLILQLKKLSKRQARCILFRYFGQMTCKEVSQVLDVSVRTVSNDSRVAHAWLASKLKAREGNDLKKSENRSASERIGSLIDEVCGDDETSRDKAEKMELKANHFSLKGIAQRSLRSAATF